MHKTAYVSAIAMFLGMSGSTRAADVYERSSLKDAPVYTLSNTWAGLYIGANGGYGWSAHKQNVDTVIADPLFGPILFDTSRRADPSGGFGGAQAGYNWQRDRIVFGVEADIQGSGIFDKRNDERFGPNFLDKLESDKSELLWFGTARGRIGYAWEHTLAYFTGGLAFGNVKDQHSTFQNHGDGAQLTKEGMQTGYVLGGGLEFKPDLTLGLLGSSWTVKFEYQYINLGSTRLEGSFIQGPLPGFSNDLNHEYQTVRIGMNYHINIAEPSLK